MYIVNYLEITCTMHNIACSSQSCNGPNLTSPSGCLCAGDNLQLICTAIGGVNTEWTGSAILNQCSDSIILRHSAFSRDFTRSCNSQAVIGQSLPSMSDIASNCYASKLSITITSNLNGTDIVCQIDNTVQQFDEVGQYNVSLTSGNTEQILCNFHNNY